MKYKLQQNFENLLNVYTKQLKEILLHIHIHNRMPLDLRVQFSHFKRSVNLY